MAKKLSYNSTTVEDKWQKKWSEDGVYTPDIKEADNPFYNLWMFPYPSGEGLHAGHAFASTGSDVYGRYMRMNGRTVFQPIGYDSFGIHAENFAIKIGEKPQVMLDRTTKNYERQMRSLGHGYDWTRTVTTSNPDYYKWTQWLFIQMFQAGLAYKKKALVNFCPGCKTVLSDEQIVTPSAAGKLPPGYDKIEDVPEGVRVCERCGNIPERRELSQWLFKITDYADRLLQNLDIINWSERVKVAQREWIGRKEGVKVKFKLKVKGQLDKHFVEVFTTRIDTISGVTFIAIAPELAQKWIDVGWKAPQKISEYVQVSLKKTDQQRKQEADNKSGVDTEVFAVHPANGESLPVWVTDYVLMDVGTGAVMGVPGHDERDMQFAKKFGLDIKEIIPEQMEEVTNYVEEKGWGKRETTYHLRDWLISRQRYWGPPIPMIYCAKCDWQPVPEEDLPVILPDIDDYQPKGEGEGPLANHPEFYETTCPNCGGKAKRETDVSDTFLDSSWYFLRYPSVDKKDKPWDPEITKKWLPVNLYFGGAEHSVLHLMYARFATMAMHDMGHLDFEEPFPNFFAHGLMIKDGAKMSKSRGNVVNPDEYVEKYGADTLRLYLMFMGPMDGNPDFRDTGIEGMARFVNKLWRLFNEYHGQAQGSAAPDEIVRRLHQTIKKLTEDIKVYHYNTAIAAVMEYVNLLTKTGYRGKDALLPLAQLIAPFAPHLAEEVWREVFGNSESVHISSWPKYNEDFIKEDEVEIPVQVDGKLRSTVKLALDKAGDQGVVVALAESDENVKKWLEGKGYKAIFVPGRLVNFVTA